jgi:hypothetical protein
MTRNMIPGPITLGMYFNPDPITLEPCKMRWNKFIKATKLM